MDIQSNTKNILSVQNFLFQEKQFKIYGTNENPLFKCSDILIHLLGYKESNENRFYRDNKTNSKYIAPSNCRGIVQENYFTELGLYRCLFSSGKSIATEFQEEIPLLLKNIRLGVVGLQILNEQEYKKQLEEKDNQIKEQKKQLVDFSDQIESLEEDNQQKQQIIQSATKTCSLYKQLIYDKNGNNIGIYGGSTNQDPKKRDDQHRSNSCNRGLREALEQGKTMQMQIVETFQYVDDNVRKRKERDLILSIEEDKRLNIQIPRVTLSHNTTEESKEETELISAVIVNNVIVKHQKYYGLFTEKVQKLKQFLIDNKKYPNKRNEDDKEEKMLGQFVDTLRQQLNNPKCNLPMPQERRDYLFQQIPNFIQDDKEYLWRLNVQELANFIELQNRYPIGKKGQWNEDNYSELKQNIKDIELFIRTEKRMPRSNQIQDKSIPESELLLGFKLHNIRTSLKAQTVQQSVAIAKKQYLIDYFPTIYQVIVQNDPNLLIQ